MKETIYTKPLRTPDERPSRITDSIKITTDGDTVVKVEQLAPVAKVLNSGSVKLCKAELVVEPNVSTLPYFIAVYKIIDEEFVEFIKTSNIPNFLKMYTPSNYTLKGISELPYNVIKNFINSSDDEPTTVEEGLKFLKECLIDGGIITSPLIASLLDNPLNSAIITFAENYGYSLANNIYYLARCLDFFKFLKWAEEHEFTDDNLVIVLMFHLFGRLALKHDDENMYIITAFGVPQIDDNHTIYYTSEYGDCPDDKTVTDGYMLDEYDLPELSDPGYSFKGWYDSDGNKVTVGQNIYSDLHLHAEWVSDADSEDPEPEPDPVPDPEV